MRIQPFLGIISLIVGISIIYLSFWDNIIENGVIIFTGFIFILSGVIMLSIANAAIFIVEELQKDKKNKES